MENIKRKEISEFYKQMFSGEKLKERLKEKAKKIASEEDLRKLIREEIMPLMKKFKVNFSEDELFEFEKGTREELSDEALEGVSGGLSVNSSVAGGILTLMLVAGGGMALGQTTFASDPEPDTPTSISMQADEKNDDEYNEIDFENELINEWTDENIRAFVNYLDNLSEDYFVDNSEGHGLKDEYENLMNNLRSLKEAIGREEAKVPDDVADDLGGFFYFTFDDEDFNFGYNMGNNDSDEDKDDEEVSNEIDDDEENDDDEDEEVSNEAEEDADNDDEVSNEADDENVDIDFGKQVLEDNEWTVKKIIVFNDQLNQTPQPNKQMQRNLRHINKILSKGNFDNLSSNVALSLLHHSHALEVESFKEELRFTPITPHGSNFYNNFAECLNNLPQNYFDITGAFNDEASETLKSNLYFACRYIHVTPEGKVCADQDGKDMISSKVLKTLVNFSRCNSGYKFNTYAASHDKLSEVVKFAMFNAPSSIERLDSKQLDQWYASYLELNQSGKLDNLSPEIRDTLDVFILVGREAEIFSSEETSNNNEEASSTIATSNETTSNTNDDETSNTSSEGSSILARAASATVSAIGSTIKEAGKLVGKIFSFWK